MEITTHPITPPDKTYLRLITFFYLILYPLIVKTSVSPHQIYNFTWLLYNQAGDVVNSTSKVQATIPWDPIQVDLCALALGAGPEWGTPDLFYPQPSAPKQHTSGTGPGCGSDTQRAVLTLQDGIYVCPGSHRPRETHYRCGWVPHYCGSWGCETTGDVHWKPSSKWDYILVKRTNPPRRTYGSPDQWPLHSQCGSTSQRKGWCNPLEISFTQAGQQAPWSTMGRGFEWSLCLYQDGRDSCLNFRLKLQITSPSKMAVGPNKILTKQKSPPALPFQKEKFHKQVLVKNRPTQTPASNRSSLTPQTPVFLNKSVTTTPPLPGSVSTPLPGAESRLLSLIHGAYQALNNSNPNRTQDCWMCLASPPPYYEGVAVVGNWTNHTNVPPQCSNLPSHRLTLTEVTGQGLCVGSVPPRYQGLCNKTMTLKPGAYYLTGPDGLYWACNTGLTPCLAGQAHNQTHEWCVMVEVWPRVTLHNSEEVYQHYEGNLRFRREPVSITLALILGGLTVGGIGAGIGTGAAALHQTNQFHLLQQAMHSDLRALEESVSALEKSLTSLSEVVLQNRRGLDLVFLKEGGLCAALKEECCFYVDHTGVVRDNMAKLRERLKQRESYFKTGQSWFQGWFNSSPWLTTLISSVTGPLVVLLLIITIGPCIINRLLQFINDKMTVTHALILTLQHQSLKLEDIEDSL
ncbi:LOW QUALITY PROTEIN: MLV-related proviral Env polyprotein-like [Lepus europaeus]|uniref:LOW QUALITY PROTEIN: MLV-related proviral Env polyprotein-like n=1 Tax=Lepus europaeus TaxID=9983 RepID=UPI002B4983DF|nr:LOW QUALITY PROTEIN: MLV-related proviral Env polyprotein-like [Lepus europaeus]